MTLFHFGNCVALAYVPYVIVYRCSGMAEYSAFWKCVQAGTAYLFTQLCKMLVLATFFPATEFSSDSLDVVGIPLLFGTFCFCIFSSEIAETLKCFVDLADLVGLYLLMNSIPAKGQLKFLIAGMGWATAELIMTRFIPLWVGARGIEFDWKFIQMSFDSNVSLIQHISTALLVWLWTRSDLRKSLFPVVFVLLLLSSFRPLIVEILIHAGHLGSWTLLFCKGLFTLSIGTIAMQMFLGMSR